MTSKIFYCILIHYDEIAVKLGNRNWFERILIQNIRKQLKGLSYSSIQKFSARIFINEIDYQTADEYLERLKNVMGLSSVHLMEKVPADINIIEKKCIESLTPYKDKFNTFKILTKRQNKSFQKTSPELNAIIGDSVRKALNKTVKLKNPDVEFRIEIIEDKAFIGYQLEKGYGGLPVGCSERAISLLSSGIDSPVASFEMLKRGVQLSYVHFHSFPVTGSESIENVEKILKVLSKHQNSANLFLVPFSDVQKHIMKQCPQKYWIIIFRRAMVMFANYIAYKENAKALVTGENVGQVASQTISNIHVINKVSTLPILRPLIGYNKKEIINLATMINTYDISILPYDDCCSFFVPKHPETKAKLEIIEEIEKDITLDFDNLYNSTDKKIIRN